MPPGGQDSRAVDNVVGRGSREANELERRNRSARSPSRVGGAGRIADLPLFRIKDHRAELATEVALAAQRYVVHVVGRRCTWMYETRNETTQIDPPAGVGALPHGASRGLEPTADRNYRSCRSPVITLNRTIFVSPG